MLASLNDNSDEEFEPFALNLNSPSKSMDRYSLKLLEKNENESSLKINESALDFIRRLEGPVCPIVIMGQYRTGKSYLVSSLFGNSPVFKVGHTDQPETKGIWMGTEKVKIHDKKLNREMNLLLIDTEGLESFDSDDKWDTNLFLASLLLSSVLIYNTKNTLAKDAFNKLSVATCISEKVKFNSKLSSAMNATKLKQQGPDLFWIVRDFSLKTTKPAQEEFEDILKYETDGYDKLSKDKQKEVDKRNEVRSSLQNAFYTLNCAYLPTPTLKKGSKLDLSLEELLQQLDKVDTKELSDNFLGDLEKIRKRIQEIMKPKKLDDQYLDGQKFAEYIRQVVHAINKEQTFCVQHVMLNIIRAEADQLLAALKSKFARKVESLFGNSSAVKPKTVNEFEDQEKVSYDESIAAIKDKLAYKEQILKEFVEKFDQYRAKAKDEYLKRLNGDLSAWDKKTLNELWVSRMKSKCTQASPQYSSVPDFERDLSQLKVEFEKLVTLKEKQDEIWRDFTQQINVDSIKIDIQSEINKKAERDRVERERQEKERLERERLEKERLERERLENQQRSRSHYSSGYSDFSFLRPSFQPSCSSASSYFPPVSSSNSGLATITLPKAGVKEVHTGPKGGQYYWTSGGNKKYLDDVQKSKVKK